MHVTRSSGSAQYAQSASHKGRRSAVAEDKVKDITDPLPKLSLWTKRTRQIMLAVMLVHDLPGQPCDELSLADRSNPDDDLAIAEISSAPVGISGG